jgi:hypothetical protein
MSNLTRYQQAEIQEITAEALTVTPPRYRQQLEPYYRYLASEYVRCLNPNFTSIIQTMIDSAKLDRTTQLAELTKEIDLRIDRLRQETITAFNAVGDEIGVINKRLNRLENNPRQTPQTRININFDNTSNAIMWVILGTLIIGTVGTLLTPVVDYQYHQKMEVNKP